ncbi:MAG TPA: hypothetical protein DDW98_08940 [Gammaproteobacteria bacterium]|jgi:DNA-binding transcriptional MerR regulator|nr:hypothetical protein [Gammaproteobacteria bacterium]
MRDEKATDLIDRMEAMRLTLVEARTLVDAYRARNEELERANKNLQRDNDELTAEVEALRGGKKAA